jgi:8-oxo-dGTP pyrophosphatase MutT (NUDIX family)
VDAEPIDDAAALRDEPVEVEVTSSDLVYEGRVWDVRSDTVRYSGHEIVRQYVDHPGAAAIVALDDEGRVLLIQQYRHPLRMRDWEIPAGLLDVHGEDPIDAARRELAEEADLATGSIEHLVSVFTTPGGNDEIVHLFLARDLSPSAMRHDREEEEADIRIAWVPLEDAVAAVMAGRMRNGILTIGLLAAAERLRGGASAAHR